MHSQGEDFMEVFSDKHWDDRGGYALIESAAPCHDTQIVGFNGYQTLSTQISIFYEKLDSFIPKKQ